VLDRFHALAASSLGQQLAGVRSLALPAPGGFHLSWSQGTVGVAALALPTGPTSGPQHGLRQVQRAVLDLPSGAGYCFDGEEATPTPGGLALEVTPGPAVNFYFWR
jgi:hypothetical protein